MAQANEARNKNPMDKATETAQSAGKTVNDTFDAVKHRTQDAMNQASDRASQMADKATQAAGQASEKVQAWAGQTFDSTSESMKGFGKEVTEVVRKYPLPALLVGFGVGLLCGRIMKM